MTPPTTGELAIVRPRAAAARPTSTGAPFIDGGTSGVVSSVVLRLTTWVALGSASWLMLGAVAVWLVGAIG